jgi:hypothetical protein
MRDPGEHSIAGWGGSGSPSPLTATPPGPQRRERAFSGFNQIQRLAVADGGHLVIHPAIS